MVEFRWTVISSLLILVLSGKDSCETYINTIIHKKHKEELLLMLHTRGHVCFQKTFPTCLKTRLPTSAVFKAPSAVSVIIFTVLLFQRTFLSGLFSCSDWTNPTTCFEGRRRSHFALYKKSGQVWPHQLDLQRYKPKPNSAADSKRADW